MAFLVGFPATPVLSLTRAPMSDTGEFSLLYWRYLCRNQPQEEEEIRGNRRELKCPNQRWKVRTRVEDDQVLEVVEDVD
jgi:hypothetical protein